MLQEVDPKLSLQRRKLDTASLALSIDIFHATTSGQADETISKFRLRGIDPAEFSDGHGQGRGFYVWTTLDRARQHANLLVEGKLDKRTAIEGRPIVVMTTVIFDTEFWDLDVECHRGITTTFLNLKIREAGGNITLHDPESKQKILLKAAADPFVNNFTVDCLENGVRSKKGFMAGQDESSLACGKTLGKVINALRNSEHKQAWCDFVRKLVADYCLSGMALKYIGQESISVSNFIE